MQKQIIKNNQEHKSSRKDMKWDIGTWHKTHIVYNEHTTKPKPNIYTYLTHNTYDNMKKELINTSTHNNN